MNYSIVYSSATGNTAAVAEKLRELLPPEECVYFGTPSAGALAAPLLFVGFWTDKGSCDEKTRAFLQTAKGKTIAMFGTAGFGSDESYFAHVLDEAGKAVPEGCAVLPGFMCQGRMEAPVRKRYEKMLADNPDSAQARMFLENFDLALSHPDQMDFEKLARWVKALGNGG